MTPSTKNIKQERSKRKPPETLRDKVQRHLRDKNDIITDEDIRDAIVGENDSEKASRIKEPIGNENETPGEQDKKTTPWNILSEGYD